MSSESLHENPDKLLPETIDQHRAITSLMEELEAVDWYNQRANATENQELRAILVHNRDEEKEHAAMVLEWLRRNDEKMNEHLKTYLFTSGSLLQAEAVAEGRTGGGGGSGGEKAAEDESLGIGDLRARRKAR